MDAITEYMLKSFRKIKADAVPRSPRPSKPEKIPPTQVPSYSTHDPEEEVYVDPEDHLETEHNTKPPQSGKKKNKKQENGKKKKSKPNNGEPYGNSNIIVNASAGNGNVVNIIGANNLHFGPTININSPDVKQPNFNKFVDPEEDDEKTYPTADIQLLFEAEIKPELKYIMHVKNNLGKNWRNIFVKLGFTKREIKDMEKKAIGYGEGEARYLLLNQWIEKDPENTLGQLARFLWRVNEKGIVEELAEMYNKRTQVNDEDDAVDDNV